MLTRNSEVRLSVGFVLSRQFTLSALSLFVDALRLASDRADRGGRLLCDWDIISSTRHLIRSSCGFEVAPTRLLDASSAADFDYIVVVGGTIGGADPIDAATGRFLKECAARRARLVGLCTGSFILARLGILDGKSACVSWLHREQFREEFPDIRVISDMLYLVTGRIITCSGGTSSADLAAHLVEKHVGKDALQNALSILLIDRPRDGSELQPTSPLALSTRHFLMQRAVTLMDEHIDEPLPLAKLADMLDISRRQLERVCKQQLHVSPQYLYLGVRMLAAWHLVVETENAMIDIAVGVGFGNASTFSRRFSQVFGILPSRLREKAKLGNRFRPPTLGEVLEDLLRPICSLRRSAASVFPSKGPDRAFVEKHTL